MIHTHQYGLAVPSTMMRLPLPRGRHPATMPADLRRGFVLL